MIPAVWCVYKGNLLFGLGPGGLVPIDDHGGTLGTPPSTEQVYSILVPASDKRA